MERASGIIMHISSLPEDYGIGSFGKWAYKFADFLHQGGQKYWQILPLGHTGYGDSPYQCFSAFAGNPYFIDLEILKEEGLLEQSDLNKKDLGKQFERVNYGELYRSRYALLRKAYINGKNKLAKEIKLFYEEEKEWIEDYALYMAVKKEMQGKQWMQWEEPIKLRKIEALKEYRVKLEEEINFWVFVQYEFFKQWKKLKDYVNRLGIKIIGDIPIYVAGDSVDVWANTELFQLDEKKYPKVVAGCPPDAFSETGQLWGNPIYDWKKLEKSGYSWWISRMRENLRLYDVIRMDHFRGFEAYWAIPYGEQTAVNGKWVKGPGVKLFQEIKKQLGKVEIIAEDLGFLTQEVLELKKETGYPGMKVLQFAFGGEDSEYLPHNYSAECVVYTGTHDNDTVVGWFETSGEKKAIEDAISYLKLDKSEGINWGFIRGAWSSVGEVAIAPMQDLLGIGNSARMNYPSKLGGNWEWRMKREELTEELARKIYEITKIYRRIRE